jgi:hypothetical protein
MYMLPQWLGPTLGYRVVGKARLKWNHSRGLGVQVIGANTRTLEMTKLRSKSRLVLRG